MRKSVKIAIATAFAGLVAAGGVAFTATGINNTAPDQFVGGTVHQSVTGADLTNIAYVYADESNTAVESVTLTFAGADGQKVHVAVNGGTIDTALQGTQSDKSGIVAANTVTFTAPVTPVAGLSDLAVTVDTSDVPAG